MKEKTSGGSGEETDSDPCSVEIACEQKGSAFEEHRGAHCLRPRGVQQGQRWDRGEGRGSENRLCRDNYELCLETSCQFSHFQC